MIPANGCSLDSQRENVVRTVPPQEYIFNVFDVLGETYPIFLWLELIYMEHTLF